MASKKIIRKSDKKSGSAQYDANAIEFVLAVIGQEKRLEILRSLLDAEAGSGVTFLANELGVKAPTVEKHLTTLKKIGLVKKQVTLDFTRERWVIRGRKRVTRLLSIVDSEIRDLVAPGGLLEEVEKAVRRQQYFKEHESTLQEIEQARKEGTTLDLILAKLSKDYDALLDDDEKKKISYWITARNAGIL